MSRGDQLEFLVLAAIWGASFLFMRIAAPEFGPIPLMLVRCAVGALVLMPVLLVGRSRQALVTALRASGWRIAFIGLLSSAIPFVLFGFAALSLNAGFSSILNATAPMFGALIGYAAFGERLTAWRIAGLVIGMAGVTVLSWEHATFREGGSGWAILACLGATFCYGGVGNLAKRLLVGVDPMLTAAGSLLSAALALLVPGILLWPADMPPPSAWGNAIALGAISSGFAYLLYYRLIAHLSPTAALSVTYLIPVFGVFWGWLFLGESIDALMLAGGLVVLLGIALTTGMLPRGRSGTGR
jgi:drug/metabolite transporter (DMT)-like permease